MKRDPESKAARNKYITLRRSQGWTLQAIATDLGVTRERIRQICREFGIEAPIDTSLRANLLKLPREKGMSYNRTPTGAFSRQKHNARKRGIPWRLTLEEWWAVWEQSGKWPERGRGIGYVMSRCGDTGAYEVGNVFIQPAMANNSVQGHRYTGRTVRFINQDIST